MELNIYRAHAAFPITEPSTYGLDDDDRPAICHPTMGWCPVTIMNAHEFAVRSTSPDLQVWFRLDDEIVSQWPVRNAAKFQRWAARCARTP